MDTWNMSELGIALCLLFLSDFWVYETSTLEGKFLNVNIIWAFIVSVI